jgi:hypothetical protein
MAKRAVRTDEVLRKASEHLHYEGHMCLTLAKALSTGVFGQGALLNMALESFTVHSRLLLKFFFDDKPREDDIVADDFFGNEGKWQEMRDEIPPILDAIKKRVDKEVAHLTYARLNVTPEAKPWPFLDIVQAVEGVWNRFIAAVPLSRLDRRTFNL